MAGWDKENGGSVYNIPLGGGLFKGPWAIGGTFWSCGRVVVWRGADARWLRRIGIDVHLRVLRCDVQGGLGTR